MTEKKTTTRKTTSKTTTSTEPTLTIDGKNYLINDLSSEAQAQIQSIRLTDQRIEQLHVELAIAQTARNAYARALNELLPANAVTK